MASTTPHQNHVANALRLAAELADVLEEVAEHVELAGTELADMLEPAYTDGAEPREAATARFIMATADRVVRLRRIEQGRGRPVPAGWREVPGDITMRAAIAELRARARGRADAEAGGDPFAGFPGQ